MTEPDRPEPAAMTGVELAAGLRLAADLADAHPAIFRTSHPEVTVIAHCDSLDEVLAVIDGRAWRPASTHATLRRRVCSVRVDLAGTVDLWVWMPPDVHTELGKLAEVTS